eukprot:gene10519-biopygen6287
MPAPCPRHARAAHAKLQPIARATPAPVSCSPIRNPLEPGWTAPPDPGRVRRTAGNAVPPVGGRLPFVACQALALVCKDLRQIWEERLGTRPFLQIPSCGTGRVRDASAAFSPSEADLSKE